MVLEQSHDRDDWEYFRPVVTSTSFILFLLIHFDKYVSLYIRFVNSFNTYGRWSLRFLCLFGRFINFQDCTSCPWMSEVRCLNSLHTCINFVNRLHFLCIETSSTICINYFRFRIFLGNVSRKRFLQSH